MVKSAIIRSESFNKSLKNKRFKSIINEIEAKIKNLKNSPNSGQIIYKSLYEKRIKNNFRLFYFKINFKGNDFIFLIFILLTDKKNQQKEIDEIKKNYDEVIIGIKKFIKEKFKIE